MVVQSFHLIIQYKEKQNLDANAVSYYPYVIPDNDYAAKKEGKRIWQFTM